MFAAGPPEGRAHSPRSRNVELALFLASDGPKFAASRGALGGKLCTMLAHAALQRARAARDVGAELLGIGRAGRAHLEARLLAGRRRWGGGSCGRRRRWRRLSKRRQGERKDDKRSADLGGMHGALRVGWRDPIGRGRQLQGTLPATRSVAP